LDETFFNLLDTVSTSQTSQTSQILRVFPKSLEMILNFTNIVPDHRELKGIILVDRPAETWSWGVPFLEADKSVFYGLKRRNQKYFGTKERYFKFLVDNKIVPLYLSLTAGSNAVENGKHEVVWLNFMLGVLRKLITSSNHSPVSLLTWNKDVTCAVEPLHRDLGNKMTLFETNHFFQQQRYRDSFDWFIESFLIT